MSRRNERVAVAMSGGVDSSVTALILLREGYDVIGLTMDVPGKTLPGSGKAGVAAAAVAKHLGIPHHLIDMHQSFETRIIRNFCREYGRGRTPNPCIGCNEIIKFGLLWKRAKALGAAFMATGHYARIESSSDAGCRVLKKGTSPEKDQSYFLYTLDQEKLSRTLFPLGTLTKTEVRRMAKAAGLPVAERDESQEICFIPDGDYPRFLKKRMPEAFRSGPIKDEDGRFLGTHRGIGSYTIGQRRGLGIAAPAPLYVLAIDASADTLVAGPNTALFHRALEARDVRWTVGHAPQEEMAVKARIRYRHKESAALVIPGKGGRARVEFQRAQRAITPGQSVVFYEGEVVVGGGIIEEATDP